MAGSAEELGEGSLDAYLPLVYPITSPSPSGLARRGGRLRSPCTASSFPKAPKGRWIYGSCSSFPDIRRSNPIESKPG